MRIEEEEEEMKEGKGDERDKVGRFQMLESLIGNTIIYFMSRPVLQKPIFASLQSPLSTLLHPPISYRD